MQDKLAFDRQALIDWVRKELGTSQILERIDRLERTVGKDAPASSIEILPGTEYSRYAIPVDYPPSRDFKPRYGYSRRTIQALGDWFELHNDKYSSFLRYMRSLNVGHLPVALQPDAPLSAAWTGGAICAFDELALYAIVTKHSPKTYIEIGSGMTTCFSKQAIEDAKLDTRIISIDPEPRGEIDAICDEVIRNGLETCDLSIFETLKPGDILFFDGSHRSFMNSDVTVFFIDVLPLIKPGVLIHVHDILLPWDYPDSFKHWYWNEQYMLAVYLMSSMDKLEPILPTTWICRSPRFERHFDDPFVDLGSREANQSWRGGGSMWFSKKIPNRE